MLVAPSALAGVDLGWARRAAILEAPTRLGYHTWASVLMAARYERASVGAA